MNYYPTSSAHFSDRIFAYLYLTWSKEGTTTQYLQLKSWIYDLSKKELCWSGTVSSSKANCWANDILGKHLPGDYRDKSGLASALKMWLVLITEMRVGCSGKTCWLADFQEHWAVFDWLAFKGIFTKANWFRRTVCYHDYRTVKLSLKSIRTF